MTPGYRVTSDLREMDLEEIHRNITNSCWASGIPIETFTRALENSMCFGVLTESGEQVGFARVITDKATFAYLADVYIKDEHQKLGLSKQLISNILVSSELQGLRRFVLATKDAHSRYRKYGFAALQSPEIFMEIWDQEVYINA